MKRRTGTKTVHPGVRRLDNREYLIRASTRCPTTGRQIEKERRLTDTILAEAVKARILLKEELNAEFESENLAESKVRVRRVLQNQDMTLGEYTKRWFVHGQKTGSKRPHTLKRNLQLVERFILPLLGHLRLVDIGKPELHPRAGFAHVVDGESFKLQKRKGQRTLFATNVADGLGFDPNLTQRRGRARRNRGGSSTQSSVRSKESTEDDDDKTHPHARRAKGSSFEDERGVA